MLTNALALAHIIRRTLEGRNIPGILYNAHKALESIDRLRRIKNAVYIYPHDNQQTTIM